jgi:hypothetical protein
MFDRIEKEREKIKKRKQKAAMRLDSIKAHSCTTPDEPQCTMRYTQPDTKVDQRLRRGTIAVDIAFRQEL